MKTDALDELKHYCKEREASARQRGLARKDYPENSDIEVALAYGLVLHMVELLIEHPGRSLKEIENENP